MNKRKKTGKITFRTISLIVLVFLAFEYYTKITLPENVTRYTYEYSVCSTWCDGSEKCDPDKNHKYKTRKEAKAKICGAAARRKIRASMAYFLFHRNEYDALGSIVITKMEISPYREAEKFLDNFLKRDKDNIGLLLIKARMCDEVQDGKCAHEAYERILDLDEAAADRGRIFKEAINSYLFDNNIKNAVKLLKRWEKLISKKKEKTEVDKYYLEYIRITLKQINEQPERIQKMIREHDMELQEEMRDK